MKIAAQPTLTQDLEAGWVLAPAEVEFPADLEFVPDGSVFIASLEDVAAASAESLPPHLVLSDLRLDVVEKTVQEWLEKYSGGRVTLLWPLREYFLVGELPHLSDSICLENWILGDRVAYLSFRRSAAGDRDASILSLGIALGSGVAGLPAFHRTSAEEIAEHLSHYDALLARLLAAGEHSVQESAAPGAPARIASTVASSAGEDELKTKVYELELKQASMQHRYDALANSTLGKLTLKYWDTRRKLRKKS